jgi:hypothetical protein
MFENIFFKKLMNKKLRHKAEGKYNISKIVDDCPGTLHAY